MEVNFKLEQIMETAATLMAEAPGCTVFAFHGEMGVGKTTLIHALCDTIGVLDSVTSPTFSIINQYKTADARTVYHLDLYRIKDETEAINTGIEDCLYSENICFVEWPGKAPGIFPDNTLHVSLSAVDDNTRKLKFNL